MPYGSPKTRKPIKRLGQTFERTFSNGTTETRYMAEVIYGKRHRKQYGLLTTEAQTLPDNSTSFVMVAAAAIKLKEIGNHYGFRTWIEYGLKQAKDAIGWADLELRSANANA